ncbi:hypothetical protein Acy02nite_66280 [Actinoplanes cyaneus]|uniref:Uncharacterized protein n=1 Tax=Actinoplanes cyaneus TaxID=52696 RepID=A0A919IQT7_9ACTN|nr:hypothetical protein [Actinoplanes cyaneus]GID68747.1 hypothetical protein Acy02nite_66280 [Actinoplanes cyaneus]
MGSTGHRRSGLAAAGSKRGRLLAVAAVVVAAGGAIGFAQLSHADETPQTKAAGESGAGKVVNGQKILTDTCIDSKLPAHDGFQKGDRCVSTEFGEVASAANDAALLITEAPADVAPNTPFTLKVSTRNLIRDRFLAAGQGGYYVESSVLQNGIVRGHFHTACRMLAATNAAPDPAPVPAFFVATEDKKGGRAPDTVTIQVPGLPTEGTAQCASWAGDGSHRTPMMERANQTPAIDAVRITVRAAGGGNNNGGNQGGNNGGNQGGNQGNNGGNQGNTGGNNNTGGNTGNNNGGANQGGNNNQNNGGNNTGGNTNPGTVTATPKTTVKSTVKPETTREAAGGQNQTETPATTKGTTKPATTSKPATTTKPATTKSTKSTTTTDSDSSSSGDSSSSDNSATTTETTKPEPAATETPAAAGAAADYGIDVGAPDNAAPTSTTGDNIAEPPANTNSGGPFTLVSEHPAIFGGGAVLVLLAIIGFAFTRSRPRRY